MNVACAESAQRDHHFDVGSNKSVWISYERSQKPALSGYVDIMKFLPAQASRRKLFANLDQFGPIFISHRAKNLGSLSTQGSQGLDIRSLLAEKDSRAEQCHDPGRLSHTLASLSEIEGHVNL